MLLQELIPSGAVLQVWKTITFRDYDSSVFRRNILTLYPSYITEHPEIPGFAQKNKKQA